MSGAQTIAGHIDRISMRSLCGWARDPHQPDRQVVVDFYLNGQAQPFYAMRADQRHPTLLSAGLPEYHAFRGEWPQPLRSGDTVEARVRSNNRPLWNSPALVPRLLNENCLVSTGDRYAVYYNPKSACSYIRKLFMELHRDETDLAGDAGVAAAGQAFLSDAHLACLDEPGIKIITAVRHPAQRVASMFLDKVATWLIDPERCAAQDIFRHCYGTAEARYAELNFLRFLEYLQQHIDRCDLHFRRQPSLPQATAIWRVENLQQDIADFYIRHYPHRVDQVTELTERTLPAYFNRSQQAEAFERKARVAHADALSIADIAGHMQAGYAIAPASLLSERALALIESVYGEEAACYGYSLR